MFCYIFRLSFKQSYRKKQTTKDGARATTAQLYPRRDTFEFDQGHESTNHGAHFVERKSSYITMTNIHTLSTNCLWKSFWLDIYIFNPLTPGTFCKKCVFWTFWWFLGCSSAKLALIRSKMRLQHNSLPFLPPASRLAHCDSGMRRKWKFSFSFLFAAVIDLLLGLLAVKKF